MLEDFLQNALYLVPVALLSLSFHEFAHGWAAYKLGDPTAKEAGRLTLNPLAHLDILGTIAMLLLRFGWAKPVPVNPMYFKNRKRDSAITAAAGPLSNLLLAFVCLFLFYVVVFFVPYGKPNDILQKFLIIMVSLNVGLAVFNLLPISPLDGSKILYAVLPNSTYFKIMRYEKYFMPALFLLLWMGVLSGPISWLRDLVISGMQAVILPVFRLLWS
ncbi:MAG TPA: site-2 protease family protein [Terriglobales bacterium]|nr:site-2 protease family protein [Terriglobales bacterium]